MQIHIATLLALIAFAANSILCRLALAEQQIEALNFTLLRLLSGALVLAILVQVVFRYGFNNALPWPDEAARFCMLWMTGLMAPTAFRRGGFVATRTPPLPFRPISPAGWR